jgi:hypothetical protein
VERSNVLRQHPLHSSLPINVVMELVSFLWLIFFSNDTCRSRLVTR